MKDNIFVHNLRLNLDHEEDLAIHRALMNFRKDIYKSKSEYHKMRLYTGIYGENVGAQEIPGVIKKQNYISRETLQEILSDFKADIMKEISEMVISIFADKVFARIPVAMIETKSKQVEEELDDAVVEAACRYFGT